MNFECDGLSHGLPVGSEYLVGGLTGEGLAVFEASGGEGETGHGVVRAVSLRTQQLNIKN